MSRMNGDVNAPILPNEKQSETTVLRMAVGNSSAEIMNKPPNDQAMAHLPSNAKVVFKYE